MTENRAQIDIFTSYTASLSPFSLPMKMEENTCDMKCTNKRKNEWQTVAVDIVRFADIHTTQMCYNAQMCSYVMQNRLCFANIPITFTYGQIHAFAQKSVYNVLHLSFNGRHSFSKSISLHGFGGKRYNTQLYHQF